MAHDGFPIEELLDIALRDEWERDIQAPTLGPWKRASSMGNCLRAQILEMRGIPATKVWSDKEIRRLLHGNLLHRRVQSAFDTLGVLVADEVALKDEELKLSGHADMILGGPVQMVSPDHPEAERLAALRFRVMASFGTQMDPALVELKPTNSRAMKFTVAKGPSDHHMMQLAAYKILAERNPDQIPVPVSSYLLALIGKDFWGMLRFPLTANWVKKAEQRIDRLNELWEKGEVPRCSCPSYWSEYCQFPVYENGKATACCPDELAEAA